MRLGGKLAVLTGAARGIGLLELPFYHPTFEEGLKPALREICKAVDVQGSSARDDRNPPGA